MLIENKNYNRKKSGICLSSLRRLLEIIMPRIWAEDQDRKAAPKPMERRRKMQRKKYSAQLKAEFALEAAKENKTINEISGKFGMHPTQIQQRKKQLLEELPNTFNKTYASETKEAEELKAQLYQ